MKRAARLPSVLSVLSLMLCGCFSYGTVVSVHSLPAESAADTQKAVALAATLATRHGWTRTSEALMESASEGAGYTMVAQYMTHGQTDGPKGSDADLAFSVTVSSDGTLLKMVLKDLSNGRETDYFRDLERELKSEVAVAFPGRDVKVVSKRIGRGFAP
jgi:hypothetical protein